MKKLLCLFAVILSYASANFSWTPPVTLSEPGTSVMGSKVALDPAGNAVAVWRSELGAEIVIQAATKLVGQDWSAPETISVPGELTDAPNVKVDAAGNAVAIWVTNFGSGSLRSANKLFGMPWSAPDLVPGSENGAVDCDLAVAPDGKVTIVWFRSPTNRVFASERDLLGPWPPVPTSLSIGDAVYPRLGMDAVGNVIATWEKSTNILFARKPFDSAVWGPTLTAYGLGGAFAPQISVNLAGDAAIVWSGTAGVGAVYIPANQLADPAIIIPGSSTSPNSRPNIGLDNNGNAIAVWVDGGVFFSTKLFGQTWSTPTVFGTEGQLGVPSVSVSSCNYTLISFSGAQGATVRSGIIGSSFSAPYVLGGIGADTCVAQNPCGNAVAVFEGSTLASSGLLFSNVTSFVGVQRKNQFGTLSEYENKLLWTIDNDFSVAGFRIYREGVPIAFVKGNKRKYIDTGRVKNVPVQYSIASVDSLGAETSQTFVTVP